jgi:hypothetical protein
VTPRGDSPQRREERKDTQRRQLWKVYLVSLTTFVLSHHRGTENTEKNQ